MGFFEDLFGTTDRSAQYGQLEQSDSIMQRSNELAERARDDAMRLFPSAQNSLANAIDQAIGVNRAGTEAQLDTFQQGQDLARRMQLMGLSGYSDAIMGLPTQDLSLPALMRAYTSLPGITADTSFLNTVAPRVPDPTALGMTSDPTYGGQFTPGGTTPRANRPTENAGVATDSEVSTINRIVDMYRSGDLSEAQGTRTLINTANSMGLDLGQLSSILNLPPDTILRLASENDVVLNRLGDSRGARV